MLTQSAYLSRFKGLKVRSAYVLWNFYFFLRLSTIGFACSNFLLAFLSKIQSDFFFFYRFIHLHTKSLGVKFFLEKSNLFLDLGYSHYCVIKVPKNMFVFSRKKNLYLLSMSEVVIGSFLYLIWRLKKFSIYKNKGLIPSNRSKYLKLKLGKKQQV